jgi:hypothetical protein
MAVVSAARDITMEGIEIRHQKQEQRDLEGMGKVSSTRSGVVKEQAVGQQTGVDK